MKRDMKIFGLIFLSLILIGFISANWLTDLLTPKSTGMAVGPKMEISLGGGNDVPVSVIFGDNLTTFIDKEGFPDKQIIYRTKNNLDFDGDGKEDYAVFRAVNGKIRYIESSTNSIKTTTQEVSPDWVASPADFDGDGKTDLAWFLPSSQKWRIYLSNNSYQELTPRPSVYGNNNIPLPGDFDGDGIDDIAVFRTINGKIRYNSSTTGRTSQPVFFNASNRKSTWRPAIADYDGDGKTDLAWFDPETKKFMIFNKENNVVREYRQQLIAGPSDMPVPADYDGDGRDDIAVFRAFNGKIRWKSSLSGIEKTEPLSDSSKNYIPAIADYNGDGVDDIVYYDPENDKFISFVKELPMAPIIVEAPATCKINDTCGLIRIRDSIEDSVFYDFWWEYYYEDGSVIKKCNDLRGWQKGDENLGCIGPILFPIVNTSEYNFSFKVSDNEDDIDLIKIVLRVALWTFNLTDGSNYTLLERSPWAVQEIPITYEAGCTNEEGCTSNGLIVCNNEGTGLKTCGNYDADACLEWNMTSCSSGQICQNGVCIDALNTCVENSHICSSSAIDGGLIITGEDCDTQSEDCYECDENNYYFKQGELCVLNLPDCDGDIGCRNITEMNILDAIVINNRACAEGEGFACYGCDTGFIFNDTSEECLDCNNICDACSILTLDNAENLGSSDCCVAGNCYNCLEGFIWNNLGCVNATESANCLSGCIDVATGKCAKLGFRPEGVSKYCGFNGLFSDQKAINDTCQNEWECFTGACHNNKCVDLLTKIEAQANLLNKIWCLVKRLFGTHEAECCNVLYSDDEAERLACLGEID